MRNLTIQNGMVFNKREVKTDTHEFIFFLLSVSQSYKDNDGQLQNQYNYVQCMYSKRIGQENTKYNLIKEHIHDRSVVLVEGQLKGYYEDLSKKYEELTEKRLVLRNLLYINHFTVLRQFNDNEEANEVMAPDRVFNEENKQNNDDFLSSLTYSIDV